jgi:hypothetical protein
VLQIASRISQLYYHNYIRTGQFPFLYDSYVFYEAIASREYFKVSRAERGDGRPLALDEYMSAAGLYWSWGEQIEQGKRRCLDSGAHLLGHARFVAEWSCTWSSSLTGKEPAVLIDTTKLRR